MKEITIHLYEASEGGFMYEIYDCAPEDTEDVDSIDGGFCTTTIENALDMARDQALLLINHKKI